MKLLFTLITSLTLAAPVFAEGGARKAGKAFFDAMAGVGEAGKNSADAPVEQSGAPKLYASDGTYLGKMSANKYDPESISNPYGKYGSEYSADSVNNPYGRYGSKYSSESPNNPYAN